ncbi:MAG: DUF393 domain-containing protein [Pelagibacterales bacterium]|nr:DUF393 domain-containing protein [Pelagibacterales bacterium]
MKNILNKEMIIYDGICVLCNNVVKWVIKKDKHNLFLISNLQSKFIKKNFPDLKKFNSVAVIQIDGEILYKSKAIKHILKRLNKLRLFRILLNLSPLFISNLFYDIVSKIRYSLFGKYDSCPIIEIDKDKFIC